MIQAQARNKLKQDDFDSRNKTFEIEKSIADRREWILSESGRVWCSLLRGGLLGQASRCLNFQIANDTPMIRYNVFLLCYSKKRGRNDASLLLVTFACYCVILALETLIYTGRLIRKKNCNTEEPIFLLNQSK